MTSEEFEKIMNSDQSRSLSDVEGDNALLGLNLIAKYLPESGIEAAEHDIIYACGVDDLLKGGITREDAVELRELNWMLDEDSLACFI